jgi:hypothetical protein
LPASPLADDGLATDLHDLGELLRAGAAPDVGV